MSIEQKIAQILAESKAASEEAVQEEIVETTDVAEDTAAEEVVAETTESLDEGQEVVEEGIGDVAQKGVDVVKKLAGVVTGTIGTATGALQGAVTGARKGYHAIADETDCSKSKDKKMAKEDLENKEEMIVDVKDDVAALVNGEDLSEEFKTKAATIFEAAIVSRVKAEVAKLEEEFEARIQEEAAKNQEGLVEKVDGYLNYVVETWIKNNEIALENGMKSEILEGFVSGLKGLFEEHYIDIPEEKFDVLGSLEEQNAELQAKLDEQVAANVELNKVISEATREAIIDDATEGLAETDKEKFAALAEELTYEDAESFGKKVQTIRENYFTKTVKSTGNVESVVTDTPVESITEEIHIDPRMKQYVTTINNFNK